MNVTYKVKFAVFSSRPRFEALWTSELHIFTKFAFTETTHQPSYPIHTSSVVGRNF